MNYDFFVCDLWLKWNCMVTACSLCDLQYERNPSGDGVAKFKHLWMSWNHNNLEKFNLTSLHNADCQLLEVNCLEFGALKDEERWNLSRAKNIPQVHTVEPHNPTIKFRWYDFLLIFDKWNDFNSLPKIRLNNHVFVHPCCMFYFTNGTSKFAQVSNSETLWPRHTARELNPIYMSRNLAPMGMRLWSSPVNVS